MSLRGQPNTVSRATGCRTTGVDGRMTMLSVGQTRNPFTAEERYTEWRTKCHTIDCTHHTFLFLQEHLTPGTELLLIGWKIVPNEEHIQCDHRFASFGGQEI